MFKWLTDSVKNIFGKEQEQMPEITSAQALIDHVDDVRIILFCEACIANNFHDPILFNSIYEAYCDKMAIANEYDKALDIIEISPEIVSNIKRKQLQIQSDNNTILNDISFRQFKDLSNRSKS